VIPHALEQLVVLPGFMDQASERQSRLSESQYRRGNSLLGRAARRNDRHRDRGNVR
jgi:hypothetical protein